MIDWEQVPEGARGIETTRSGIQHHGTIKDKIKISDQSGYMINFIRDGSSRERNYVPADMIALIPDNPQSKSG